MHHPYVCYHMPSYEYNRYKCPIHFPHDKWHPYQPLVLPVRTRPEAHGGHM